VREDERIVGGEKSGRKSYIYNRQELKKLLKTKKNRRILHMGIE
jgi:hypothetical protein